MIENLSLSKLIAILLAVLVAGIITLSVWSHHSTEKIKIGSDLYYQIIEANDLVADILPPPQYIVEAYLLINELRYAPEADRAALKKRFDETYEEFKLGQERWHNSDLPKPLLEAITVKTATPAQAFYKEAQDQFFPALTNANEETLTTSLKKLDAFYQANREAVTELVKASSDRKNQLEKNTISALDHYQFWSLAADAIVIAISLLIAFKMISVIRQRINTLKDGIRAVGEGNLRTQVNMSVNDEFGEMAKEINTMIAAFKNIVMQLNQTAEQLSVAATQSASVCRSGVQDAREQHHMTLQLASGMTQMASSIDNVSRGSTETLSRVELARNVTEKGIRSMEQHIGKVHNIANNIERAASNVEQLSELSVTIGSVLDVIRGIAEQTNLLALNAAIEAARAGEQGRGFAVVADEVRTLASRTGNSTTEIQKMIERLQTSTQEAVRDMVLSREDAKSGVADVTNVGDLLRNLSESVEGIHSMNSEMAQNAEEQSSVTKEFDRNLRSIANLTDKTFSGMQEINITADNLSKLALEQRRLVEQFKV